MMAPYFLHRRTHDWGEPESFNPDRFLTKQPTDRPTCSYMPFGFGRNSCVGRNMAERVAVDVLSTIYEKARLELLPGQSLIPDPSLTLRVKNPVMMRAVFVAWGWWICWVWAVDQCAKKTALTVQKRFLVRDFNRPILLKNSKIGIRQIFVVWVRDWKSDLKLPILTHRSVRRRGVKFSLPPRIKNANSSVPRGNFWCLANSGVFQQYRAV